MNHDTQAIQPERRTIQVQGKNGVYVKKSRQGPRRNCPQKEIQPGQVFGKLITLSKNNRGKKWLCECTCPQKTQLEIYECVLRTGDKKSCGCMRTGFNKTPTHNSYRAMMERCTNENSISYPIYGGRGITVCARWKDNFSSFFDDMGVRPKGTTLERVNNQLGYCPENCIWATGEVQQSNTSRNVHIEWNGMRKTAAQWTRYLGIKNYSLIPWRIRQGWTPEKALTKKTKTHANAADN